MRGDQGGAMEAAKLEGGDMRLRLECDNVHTRDSHIVFDQERHVYYVNGAIYPTSVSGFYSQFFKHFDAHKTVDKCYASWRSNKESKYYQLISYLQNIVRFPDDDSVKAEIIRSWSASGTAASGLGTKTHADIEMRLNDAPFDEANPDVCQFNDWLATKPGWKAYRTEWSLYDEESLIAGQLDALFIDEDGKYHLVDHKRVASMEVESRWKEKGTGFFSSVPNTNHGHYRVQQSMYSYMLRKNYGIEVTTMRLLQVHPTLSTYKEWLLEELKDEAAAAFQARAEQVKAGEITVKASVRKREREEISSEEIERLKKLMEFHKERAQEIAVILNID